MVGSLSARGGQVEPAGEAGGSSATRRRPNVKDSRSAHSGRQVGDPTGGESLPHSGACGVFRPAPLPSRPGSTRFPRPGAGSGSRTAILRCTKDATGRPELSTFSPAVRKYRGSGGLLDVNFELLDVNFEMLASNPVLLEECSEMLASNMPVARGLLRDAREQPACCSRSASSCSRATCLLLEDCSEMLTSNPPVARGLLRDARDQHRVVRGQPVVAPAA